MRRRLGCAVALILALTAGAAAADCRMRMAWEPYAVFSFAGADGEPGGADIELMRRVAAEAGCDLEFRQLPWARAMLELREGHVDVASSAQWIPERDSFGWFSVPYRRAEMALFVRRDAAAAMPLAGFDGLADTGIRLGTVHGYSYGSTLDAALATPAIASLVDPSPDYATAIGKLINNRIDAVLTDDVDVLVAEARALGVSDRIERHPLILPGTEYHLIWSRAAAMPAWVSAGDRVIARMRRDGSLQALIDKYKHGH